MAAKSLRPLEEDFRVAELVHLIRLARRNGTDSSDHQKELESIGKHYRWPKYNDTLEAFKQALWHRSDVEELWNKGTIP